MNKANRITWPAEDVPHQVEQFALMAQHYLTKYEGSCTNLGTGGFPS